MLIFIEFIKQVGVSTGSTLEDRPFITERLLMGCKESNQTNQTNKTSWGKDIKCKACRAFYLFFAKSDKFNNTRAQMLYSNYHVTLGLL